MSAWDRFFCACCQHERAIADKVMVRTMPRCTFCVRRAGRKTIQPRYEADDYERPELPSSVMDAYREAAAE